MKMNQQPLFPFIPAPLTEEDAERINGRNHGIQGHKNSCYLDSTLFAMFSFSSVFDGFLIPEPNAHNRDDGYDEELAGDVQHLLREGIVTPLRKSLFVPHANVMLLREKMFHLDDKLMTEEMDPQEYLQLLFHDVLHLEQFIPLSSGVSEYFHQILVQPGENEGSKVSSIQQLLEISMTTQKLKFKQIPSPALILLMPRSGSQYKMYDGILPNLSIDITDLIEDTPRECTICGTLATQECADCFGKFPSFSGRDCPSGADSCAFCSTCSTLIHNRLDRVSHKEQIVNIPYSFSAEEFFRSSLRNSNRNMNGGIMNSLFGSRSNNINQQRPRATRIPRVNMNLFAVICIETSHFVSFVKCGTDRLAPWVFFDSMADRIEKVDGTGHNIPQVKLLPKMGKWLHNLEDQPRDHIQQMMGTVTPDLKRLLTDPYICLYHSPEASMYS